MKWVTWRQNNSGAYFHEHEELIVESIVLPEGVDPKEVIPESVNDWCKCCGPRWGFPSKPHDTPWPDDFGDPYSPKDGNCSIVYIEQLGENYWRQIVIGKPTFDTIVPKSGE
jgi:hypothetical protein